MQKDLPVTAHGHRKIATVAIFLALAAVGFWVMARGTTLVKSVDLAPVLALISPALEARYAWTALLALSIGLLLVRIVDAKPLPVSRRAGCVRFSLALGCVALALAAIPLARNGLDKPLPKLETWIDVQHWIRQHTPVDALIMTPPHEEGFRIHSERAIVGEWKDGTMQYFSDAFAEAWWMRMADLGGQQRSVYDLMSEERVRTLAAKYGADFAVFTVKRKRLPWEQVYANSAYAVYRVTDNTP